MNLSEKYCKELAKTISNEDIGCMLYAAIKHIKDWTAPSRANKGLSRGTHWNMFCKDFKPSNVVSEILKFRMLQEYGEFVPTHLLPMKPENKQIPSPVHFSPDFDGF